MSGHATTTHAAAPPPVAAPTSAAVAVAVAVPDRLAELRGATRAIPRPPVVVIAPPPVVAAAPRMPESARTTESRASRSRTTRPKPGRTPTRTQTRRSNATLATNGAGWSADSGGVVGFAMAQVGKGYVFGSVGPNVYDCSGLVYAAYRRLGISLPRSTGGLAHMGRPVSRSDLQPGDLVFPTSGHVGIYIGGGRIVHASTERDGVKVSGIYAFRFARRVLN
ncbi:C40 family peptidase [Dactylosporangium sp. CS-047395]|uniref:C40 family peptidase n=1 Tax=Dactylosporangium sp. CS-047395 TaxID=3239936 RepID=UPI003D93B22B